MSLNALSPAPLACGVLPPAALAHHRAALAVSLLK
jgi:hypothetical protein